MYQVGIQDLLKESKNQGRRYLWYNMHMKIPDRIYGEIEINEPVIIDLIHSRPFQRLKHISQDGATHFLQSFRNVTRFEHSVGTWYLAKKYNRSIEEQIASLLHDIPHTAFSHVADFVMQDAQHEYHDKFLQKIIMQSEIPDMLKKHRIDLQKVLEKEQYPLLDNKLPDISVDRWDYFLRDGYAFGVLPQETNKMLQASLKEADAVFYFENVSIATLAAILFVNCSRLIWLDPTSHGAFFLLSEAIKIAMENGVLSEEDLFGTDSKVMKLLESLENKRIKTLLQRLQSGKQFHYTPKESAEFYGPNKPRFIDPLIKTDGGFKRVSEMIPGMREYFDEFVLLHTNLGVLQDK